MSKVERFSVWNPSQKTMSGDFLKVGGVSVDLRKAVDLEYERAKAAHPENPAFHMRPMFHTGSKYGAEILALVAS